MSEIESCLESENIVDILELLEDKELLKYDIPDVTSETSEKCIKLEANCSLSLIARNSIDNAMPITKNMLSHSQDAFESEDREYEEKQEREESKLKEQEPELINTSTLIDLGLDGYSFSPVENTKNVLRNFGNAQNHYALYHHEARKYIKSNINSTKEFDEWVRSLKLENFINFKKAWSKEENNKLFVRVYKRLCWDFYTQNAIPYVLSSRIKKSLTRTSHLRYVYRFLEGLNNPEGFAYFRKS